MACYMIPAAASEEVGLILLAAGAWLMFTLTWVAFCSLVRGCEQDLNLLESFI